MEILNCLYSNILCSRHVSPHKLSSQVTGKGIPALNKSLGIVTAFYLIWRLQRTVNKAFFGDGTSRCTLLSPNFGFWLSSNGVVWGRRGFLGKRPPKEQLLGRTNIISLCLRDPVAEEVELSPWTLPNHNCFFLSVIRYIDLLFKIIIELVNMASGCKTKGMLLQKLRSNCISMTISLSFCIFYVSSFFFFCCSLICPRQSSAL